MRHLRPVHVLLLLPPVVGPTMSQQSASLVRHCVLRGGQRRSAHIPACQECHVACPPDGSAVPCTPGSDGGEVRTGVGASHGIPPLPLDGGEFGEQQSTIRFSHSLVSACSKCMAPRCMLLEYVSAQSYKGYQQYTQQIHRI